MMGIWGIGAGIIVYLAGLKGIPTELYDAARIDGAGAWDSLRHITIPMISPVIFYTLVLGVVEVLQYFLVPLVLKNGTGEPGGTTLFYNLYIYKNFFTFQDMSYGATLAWVLFAITLVVTLLLFRTRPALGLLRRGGPLSVATLEGNADARDIPVVAAPVESPRERRPSAARCAATGADRSC